MNENENPTGSIVSVTIDGETVPIADFVPVESIRFSPADLANGFAGVLASVPQALTLTMKRVGVKLRHIFKRLSRATDELLIDLLGMFRPKWLYYYRHGCSGKTRRKYRKKLVRFAWEGLRHVHS